MNTYPRILRSGLLTSLAFGLVVAVSMGAAAAHQRPYLGLIAPIAALAIAETVRRYPKLLAYMLYTLPSPLGA